MSSRHALRERERSFVAWQKIMRTTRERKRWRRAWRQQAAQIAPEHPDIARDWRKRARNG